MPINSRNKGARGEREWAAVLRSMGWEEAHRGQQHAGGSDSPDVAKGIPNTHAEVKRVERLNIDKAMEQAIRDAGDDLCPYVAHRKDRGEWLVTLRSKDMEWFAMNVLSDQDSVRNQMVCNADL